MAATCRKWFYLFCAIHLVVWVLMPLIACGNGPFDSLESIAWGNQWQFGYNKHPFLAAWLSAAGANLVHSVDLSIYLLAQLSVITCFWAMWRIANAMLPPLTALASIFLLEGVYYYNMASPQFNPNILMLATWALTSLSFYKAITEQKLWQWMLAGLCAGLAMITKYEAPLLLASMFIFMCINPQARTSFKTIKPYIALCICLLVFMPNLVWLINNNFQPFNYTTDRLHSNELTSQTLNHFFQPIRFLMEQAGAILPLFAIAAPFYFCNKAPQTLNTFNRQFLYVVGLGPLVLTMLFSGVSGDWIHSLWAYPYFSFLGILLMAELRPIIEPRRWKQFLVLLISFCSVVVVARGVYLAYSPYLTGHLTAALYPGKNLTNTITDRWYAAYHTPLAYIAGSSSELRAIGAYSKDKPQPYFKWNKAESAWINEEDMRKKGAVFIWVIKHGKSPHLPPNIAKRFPTAIEQGEFALNYLTSNKKMPDLVFAYAFLPPESTDAISTVN
jgi:4-amino-4-deoxy-L-arabinose transferase-like glycosyltransferase